MGTWAYGPFDNDTAADYAGELDDLATPAERAALLTQTLEEALRLQHEPSDLRVYALGWRLETAVAAAAFVADAHRDVVRFTDSVYARHMDDDDELGDPPDVGTPSPELVALAVRAMDGVLDYMEANGAEALWLDEATAVRDALREEN